MSAPTDQAPLEGKTAPEFFESIGQKASQLDGTTNGVNGAGDEDDEPKAVDEIESLCMNCHENVRKMFHIPVAAKQC